MAHFICSPHLAASENCQWRRCVWGNKFDLFQITEERNFFSLFFSVAFFGLSRANRIEFLNPWRCGCFLWAIFIIYISKSNCKRNAETKEA